MRTTALGISFENRIQNPLKNPLIVALDVDDLKMALNLADRLAEVAGGFKVGPRLCLRYGHEIIRELAERAPVFVDNKHYDIPSTMISAVRATFEAGASLVTVHAQSGLPALIELAKLEAELNHQRPFRVLCVTILTSFEKSTLPPIYKDQEIQSHVLDLARLVKQSQLSGVVCSAQELSALQAEFKKGELYLVTPGIRFDQDDIQDQKRTMTPKEAIKQGASALVVGRPIIEAKNPLEAATNYLTAIL